MDYKAVSLLGIRKEDESFRLYVELVSQAKSRDCKEVLFALAEEEIKHKQAFQNLLETITHPSSG